VTGKKRRVPGPGTLIAAHELLVSVRPGASASPETWLAYYRRSAAVYAEVAEVDRGHHHEARYWAIREREKANNLQGEIDSSRHKSGHDESKQEWVASLPVRAETAIEQTAGEGDGG
jgi:hypothetical protein